MEELDAVNMLLRAIGSSPVNSLSNSHPEVVNARTTLRRVSKREQNRGWWFNIDYDVVYQRNSSNEISIPEEVVKFVAENAAYVKRGRKLYNNRDQTYKFECDVTAVEQVRAFEWDECPTTLQLYAAYLAGAEFINDEIEDTAKEDRFNQKAGLAKIELDKEDLQSMKVSVWHNPRIIRARGGVMPYQRGNKGLRPNG